MELKELLEEYLDKLKTINRRITKMLITIQDLQDEATFLQTQIDRLTDIIQSNSELQQQVEALTAEKALLEQQLANVPTKEQFDELFVPKNEALGQIGQ